MHDEIEELAYHWFASAHPREAFDSDPERFWAYFQGRCPGVGREVMERLLDEVSAAGEG